VEISQKKREKIRRNAEILQLKTELLIAACEGWLPAEDGNRNMERNIREKEKKRKKKPPNGGITVTLKTLFLQHE